MRGAVAHLVQAGFSQSDFGLTKQTPRASCLERVPPFGEGDVELSPSDEAVGDA